MSTWKIDSAHSEVKFKVKHLVISTVSGQFDKFDATVESSSPDFTDAKISFEADVDSINTKQPQRDGHLKSPDFFDAANYPKLTFKGTSLTSKGGNEYTLTGELSIRDVTKTVSLDVVHGGTGKGFGHSNDVAAFEITGKINRQDFHLTWNALTEAGGVVVSDEVKLEVNAEFVKQA